jgi:hypothetical protein
MNGHGPFVSLDPSADRVSDPPVLHRKPFACSRFLRTVETSDHIVAQNWLEKGKVAQSSRRGDQTYLPCYCLRRGAALDHGPAYATCRYVVVRFARNNRPAFHPDRERYCRRRYADLLAIRGLVAVHRDRSTVGPMT